jgi:hypothetical protein
VITRAFVVRRPGVPPRLSVIHPAGLRHIPDARVPQRPYGGAMTAAVFNLNGRAGYVHWHFIDISVANLAMIVAMLCVFVIALLLPFPGSRRRP